MKIRKMWNAASASLVDMRVWFFDNTSRPGMTVCPVCDRPGKVYAKHMNASMAMTLIWLYKNSTPGGDFVHLPSKAPRAVLTGNSVGTLLYWGFVERSMSDDGTKHHTGYYRITSSGQHFVLRYRRADKTVYVYNNDEVGRDTTQVSITDALGKKFDYAALMAEGAPRGPA